jgi:competence protein ComEA
VDQLPDTWRSVDASPIDPLPEGTDPATRRHLLGLAVLTVVLLLSAAALLASAPSGNVTASGGDLSTGGTPAAASDRAAGRAPAATGRWMVDVAGAVSRPGLYALPPGSRVADAIRAAGGYGPRVDAAAAAATLNLAEILHDGAKLIVPERGAGRPASSGSAAAGAAGAGGAAGGLIDLNRASATELDTLPGIGPVTAAKIIAAREERPFQAIDELLARKVVSSSVLAKIRGLVTVGGR